MLWTLTPVEVTPARRRLAREQVLAEEIAGLAEDRMNELVRACHVIIDVDPVKSLATRLLRLHPLRAFLGMMRSRASHHKSRRPSLSSTIRIRLELM